MKNQYFGDINDYRKYGLLRSIQSTCDMKLLVAWMLTPDDGSSDGKFITYLKEPDKWEQLDPPLYQELNRLLSQNQKREVRLIEESNFFNGCKYYSEYVPDKASERDVWFSSMLNKSKESDFVFLDPDNGLEIKSITYGRKNSSKFLYWQEVSALWSSGKSLLIYQHFTREKREDFIQRMLNALSEKTEGSIVEAFSTPHVLFLMALQPEHHKFHKPIINLVQEKWVDQIKPWDLK
jgi:hypothetical protein